MSAANEPFVEMSEAELAGQAGRASKADYPFRLGRTAASLGNPLDSNPFSRGSHKAKSFKDGWNSHIVEKANRKPLPQPHKQEEAKVMTPKKAIQQRNSGYVFENVEVKLTSEVKLKVRVRDDDEGDK